MTRIARFLERVARHTDLAGEVAHREEIPRRAARFGAFPSKLRPELQAGLASLGIERPWVHQAGALRRALAGSIVVVTPTASGKTLCYNLPVLDGCLAEPEARALYLFPIKALEQDQLGAFRELAAACGLEGRVTAEIYDGDTSAHRRAKIRTAPPNVVISNPDMLHVGVLAFHPKWETFFTNLQYVVLDEVHTYRGVFGSHVANVLRRLLRVAAHYGARPQIIACSATIANPGSSPRGSPGASRRVIDDNGAPDAGRTFFFLNPSRRSPATLAAKLLREAVREDLATIVFTKSRKNTELVYTWAVHGDAEAAQTRQRVPLRLSPRGAAGDRSEALLRRAQGAWSAPPRSRWASTSAAWTSASSSATRVRSRRPGSAAGASGGRTASRS